MEKKPLRPALRFLPACLIFVAATPLFSIIVNLLTIVMILSMGIDIPLAPINLFDAPIVIDYLVCVLTFCIFYCAMALHRRARIRKKWL